MGVSIRTVLMAMMIVLAVVSCAIIGAMIYNAGIKSVNQSTDLLRREIVGRTQLEIGQFFGEPRSVLLNLQAASRIEGTFDFRNPDTWDAWLCSALRINSMRPTYIGTEDGRWGVATLEAGTGLCFLRKVFTVGWLQPTRMNFSALGTPYYVEPVRGPERVWNFDPRQRPWYNISRDGTAWSNVYINFNSVVTAVTVGTPMIDPALGRNVGVIATDFRTEQLLAYFRTIEVAKTGVMVLAESSTRNVVGATWDEPVVFNITRNDGGAHGNETWFQFQMARLEDFNERLLRGAVANLGSDELFECNDVRDGSDVRCARTYGKGRNRVFVDVVGIRDEYGLNLRLIVLIPESDFLTDMWKRADVAIGVAIGAVAVVIILSMVVVFFVLRPLQRVEERLYQTATLEDDGSEDDAQSIFTEVANIQIAYAKMVAELKRIRSFVPQSLLRTLDNVDNEDEEEDTEVGESTIGKSAISGSAGRSKRESCADEKSRVSRRTSNLSGASKAALAAGRQLQTAVGLATRRVTVVVANLAGFHALAKNKTLAELLTLHANALRDIAAAAAAHKGVLDVFSGDHFTLTFNAVTNVASHVTRAAACILQIGAKVPTANFGAATGQALCGNMGTDEVKRFSVVGPLVGQAHVLERLCKMHAGITSLVSFACYESMQFEYVLRCVDVVRLPFTAAAAPIATIAGVKQGGASDEWMYELQNSESAAGVATAANEAFLKYVQGGADEAAELAAKLPDDALGVARLREMVHAPMDEYVRQRYGAFFAQAMCGDVPQLAKPL